ncbi:class I SAM-dependent methyltransferase [Amycolatopsis sp. 195334CR]|uniref:class I SAM-dependent methyltransferase n=1 Tax=Amycolatopsis sp. 195334CR TaxID=2814588 RepID=UPI001A8D9980|nr:class I SAM-dependent methyltransferase [Amycolatopsis sp. 195334CR]MBN6034648.1 class I SAM-dependent methyltransferase [Amycolatopsis sp. 195334CR]
MSQAIEFWEDFYAEREVWSGQPNALLVREAADLPPSTALDLGCGEGADVIWLASLGWRATGVDASATALKRAAAHAADAGVTERVAWQQHDLSLSYPDGEFDLVTAAFLHSPVAGDGERNRILAQAAKAAVAPGGLLLIIGHAGEHPKHGPLPTTAEVLADLALGPDWTIEKDEVVSRPESKAGTGLDNLLRLRRQGLRP